MHQRILPLLFALLLTTACDGAFSTSSTDGAPSNAGEVASPGGAQTPGESGGEVDLGLGAAAVADATLDEPPPKDTDGTGCRGKGKWACPITEPEPTEPTEPTEPPTTCGNGVIDEGETCDGNCPTTCSAPDSCTASTLTGDVKLCNAVCTYEEVTACVSGDGCCPSGCSFSNDNDCEKDNGGGGQIDCTDDSTWPQAWKDFEDEVIRLVNERRAQGASCGAWGTYDPAPPLTMHPLLRQAARCHTLDMDTNGYFSHTSLDGRRFTDRIYATGYTGSPKGENIAYGYTTPDWVVSGWMGSDGHCANIMTPGPTQIGIGYTNVNRSYWTMVTGAGG